MLPCPKAVQYGRDTHQATTSASPLTKSYTRLTTPAEAAHETLGLVQDLEQEILLLTAPPVAEPATAAETAAALLGPLRGLSGAIWQYAGNVCNSEPLARHLKTRLIGPGNQTASYALSMQPGRPPIGDFHEFSPS